MNFRDLHYQKSPLLVCNVWDVASAIIAERVGYQCIGTSSAAIARMLGYADGEEMAFAELYDLVRKIKKSTSIPLTVDIEAGFGNTPSEIFSNIKQLSELGVVGINIEDSVVNETRTLVDAFDFQKNLFELTKLLDSSGLSIFLNIRTDAYIVKVDNPLEETKMRISLYEQAGADGVFIPYLEDAKDIQQIAKFTSLPVNVMCTPNLPDFKLLQSLGIKRISMGNYVFHKVCQEVEKTLASITSEQSFSAVFT